MVPCVEGTFFPHFPDRMNPEEMGKFHLHFLTKITLIFKIQKKDKMTKEHFEQPVSGKQNIFETQIGNPLVNSSPYSQDIKSVSNTLKLP